VRKRLRGKRQKLERLLAQIDAFEPFRCREQRYEHFHVPCCRQLLEGPGTRGWVQTAFCRKWLETAERFLAEKPADLPFCKVVAVLEWPGLWDSQLIIFYDSAYYDSFWDRQGPWQTWTPLPADAVPETCRRGIRTALRARGYAQCLRDEENGREFRDTLWFYGE
jgi:hypothetical protein